MTSLEHIVNVALRMELRVEGKKQALERDSRTTDKCKATMTRKKVLQMRKPTTLPPYVEGTGTTETPFKVRPAVPR